jgi:galactose oxidase
VLVLGGATRAVPFSDENSIYNAELWDPATERFTRLAAAAIPRNYHSVAVLLPDGRVFSGGGGLCGSCVTNDAAGQIFTPPYLLNPDGSLRPSTPAVDRDLGCVGAGCEAATA